MSEVLEVITPDTSAPLEGAPEWFNALRAEGLTSFNSQEWPTRKNENWRFGRPKNSQITDIPLADEEGMVMDIEPAPEGVIRFTFVNGFCMSIEGETPEGVTALPLNRALFEDEASVQSLIPEVQGKLGSAKLAAFHRSTLEDGAVIHISAGVQLESPIEIVNLFTGEGRSHAYALIVAEEGAKASVIETFQSTNDEDASWVDENLGVVSEKVLRKHFVDKVTLEKLANLRSGDFRRVHRGNDDCSDAVRLAIYVFDRNLSLRIRTEPSVNFILTEVC